MTHEELLLTPEYWTTKIQIELFQKVEQYLKVNGLNRSDFAKKLGVSKGYVTQVLNGDFDHRISKLVSMALAIGYIPKLSFEEISVNYNKIESVLNVTKNALKGTGYSALIYPVGTELAKNENRTPVELPKRRIVA
ncbi:helix-turn-helix domain-containing protein [Parabacteroides sp. OttesenSCG-928-G06]|nr:helix-turn-helix domain-containing protein [Parabacteroides sp. OttesenSCG-928-K15]MDL2282113.1 helix-turn-helix domain-containing protein [Parabacteroides sp. OttesenSCG-928-G06]